MRDRFASFLLISRWVSAIVALMYHLRFLLFVDYGTVHAQTGVSNVFYFLTGFGHESFAVFFIVDGIIAGHILLPHRRPSLANRTDVAQHLRSLYRILLTGLIVGAACDFTGVHIFNRTGLYTAFPEFSMLSMSYSSLLGNMFMLQPFVVPNFGSNSMLFLLSYLFWCFVMLYIFVRAAELRNSRSLVKPVVPLIVMALILPQQLLLWGAIWLSGVAVVVLGEARVLRPPALVATALFIGTLVLSRFAGSNQNLLPEPLGHWLVDGRFLLVGAGFAAIARAFHPEPEQERHAAQLAGISRMNKGRMGQIASFTFFFHFPVIMLLVGAASTLLDYPLKQQPTPLRYIEFTCLVGASVGVAAIIMCGGRRPRDSNRQEMA